MLAATYGCNNTSADQSKDVLFFYSLFVKIMYKIVNKATFTVWENPDAYIKHNIKSINTTSLSHSQNYAVKWQHTCLSHFLLYYYTILFKLNQVDKLNFIINFLVAETSHVKK